MKFTRLAAVVLCSMCAVRTTAQMGFPQRDNIVAFSAITLNESGYGSGLSWEHFLLKEKWLSFVLPVSITVNTNDYNPGHMFYFTPGIKLYTNMESYRRAKFSVGPTLVVAAGSGNTINDNFSYYGFNQGRPHFMYGFMVNAGWSLFPLPQIYFGADFGLGLSAVNRYDGYNQDVILLRSLSLKLGYMFNTRPRTMAPKGGDEPANMAPKE